MISSLWMGWRGGGAAQRLVGHRCPVCFILFFIFLLITSTFECHHGHRWQWTFPLKPVVNCADWLLQQRWVGCFCLALKQADKIRFTRLSISEQRDHQQMFIFDWIITVMLFFFCFVFFKTIGRWLVVLFLSGFFKCSDSFFQFWRYWIFIFVLFCWLDVTGTLNL